MSLISPCSYYMVGFTWLCVTVTSEVEIAYEKEAGDQEVPGWGIEVHRTTSEYIDPMKDTTIISGREICDDPKTEIVIVIESTPASQDARDAIRKSWANLTGPQVKVGFMIGFLRNEDAQKALKKESMVYKDIIEESLIESYYNLTLKSISILKWFVRRCQHAKFLLKADEDTFIDVKLLVARLTSFRNPQGVLRGYLCSDFDRDDRLYSKYYAPRYMYRHDKYPDFLQGSAYYMSRDVAEKLFAAAMATPVFHLEDVYITGLCAQEAQVKPRKDHGVVFLSAGMPVDVCVQHNIITCNSVFWPFLQWVLRERNKLNINYSKIEDEYNSENAIENDMYSENDHVYLASTTTDNSYQMDPKGQPSTDSYVKFNKPVKPRNQEVSAAPTLFWKNQPMQCVTCFIISITVHWCHTSLDGE